MKVEVRCGSCLRGFLVEEHSSAGTLSCPACLTAIELPGPTPDDAPAAEIADSPQAPAPAPAVATADLEPPPVEPDTDADQVDDGEATAIVCPRCKLHFDPKGELARRQTPVAPRGRVLVIEDLEYFRQVASDALSLHYEVVLAKNADEGRAALAAEPVQLIIVDLDLDSGDDGREFLQSLQPKPCPILIFTAQDESEMYGERWDELCALGADDLVIKGMRVAESLERKVDAMLGRPMDED